LKGEDGLAILAIDKSLAELARWPTGRCLALRNRSRATRSKPDLYHWP
jgi:hypothetical protein